MQYSNLIYFHNIHTCLQQCKHTTRLVLKTCSSCLCYVVIVTWNPWAGSESVCGWRCAPAGTARPPTPPADPCPMTLDTCSVATKHYNTFKSCERFY